ncbi:MAG TPA: Os1348 family NHLP clan protein [Ktedonobacteraceae bacterium]|nr:Os1348 family NHLP clan protein [Ktedonobacteraceae bacterium]
MSWQTINTVLGLAMVDAQFASRLLDDPLTAIQEFGFDLTEEERDVLCQLKVSNISALSQALLEKFAPQE